MQFDKRHAVTIIAAAALSANRFISYDGNHATSAGGAKDSQGVSEHEAATGEAVSAITTYSAPVLAGAAIAKGDYLKPAADGTGRAIVGTVADHCARALGAAANGQLVEAQIVSHVRPAA